MTSRTLLSVAGKRKNKMNSSLRSFFPIEVVNEVLSHLDQSSLASLCRVSYHSLEEAGPLLMRHVDITSWKGFKAFFLHPSLPSSSRLQPHLQSSYTRTLGIRLEYEDYPEGAHDRMRIDDSSRRTFPVGHSLLRLTVAYPGQLRLEPLFGRLLAHFDPVHVELLAFPDRRTREANGVRLPPSAIAHWASLRRLTCLGWLPIGGWQNPPLSVLTNLPPSTHPLDLDLDLRGDVDILVWTPRALSAWGTLGLPRLRSLRWTVRKGRQEKEIREALAVLRKEERDKVELVVVDEGNYGNGTDEPWDIDDYMDSDAYDSLDEL